MKKEKEIKTERMSVSEFTSHQFETWIIGDSPFIYNAMSAKVKGQLLYPPPKKTAASKAQKMKHDPEQEFRDTVYTRNGGDTLCVIPAVMIKAAICNAALEIPGAKKSQIGRLLWVDGDYLEMYGAPEMIMRVMRSSDMNHTPDIRTRAILPKWGVRMTISYIAPTLTAKDVASLLAVAGMAIGVGDSRPQKGKESYGKFHIMVEEDEMRPLLDMAAAAQRKALDDIKCYDNETKNLYEWFKNEKQARGR